MQDKNAWDIEQLQKWKSDIAQTARDTEVRLRDLEKFKEATVQQLITIFEKLKALQEGDTWIKRAFIVSLIGAVVSAVFAALRWAIAN